MKPKQIIVLSIILGILVAGVLFKSALRGQDPRTVRGPWSDEKSLLDFEPAKVEGIYLERRGKSVPPVSLVRKDVGWTVASRWDVLADESRVVRFLEKLRDLRGELRATGDRFYGDFGIGDAEAFTAQLTGKDGAALLDLRIGTKRAGREGYFLRRAGTDTIYLTETDLGELLGIFTDLSEAAPSADPWVDLSLFELPVDEVVSVVIERDRMPVLGIRRGTGGEGATENAWSFVRTGTPAKTVDPDKALHLLVAFNSIRAQKVVDPKSGDHGLNAPVLEITVTRKERGEVRVTVGAKDAKEDAYFVKISGRPGIFKLSADDFQELDITDERLVRETPSAKEAPKVP
ncbi:MAG: DUF4340 domain-containing protein [Candidatus Omnitrophica bacterium]|nr:DUF4340 domain-containing protein [Candidatus Omnitrophota bacterium]